MARHTPGNYVPLDVNYARDAAIRMAGPNAELLFIRSLAYAKSVRSGGGFVPEYDLSVVAVGLKAVPTSVRALVREGLWVEEDGGWRIRSWAKWNRADDQFHEERSESGAKGNHERWHVKKGRRDPDCDWCTESPHPSQSESLSDPSANRKGSKGKGREETPVTTSPGRSEAATAQTLIAEWIDNCGTRPPQRVVGHVSRELGQMLNEGIPYDDVRAGLAAWHQRNLNPSTLASVVHEIRRGPRRSTSTTDDRVNQGLQLVAHFARLDADQQQSALPPGESA